MAYISDGRCRTCCYAYNFDTENSFVSVDSSEETSSDCWSEEVEDSDMYQNGFRNNSSIYAAMEQKTYKYNGNSFQKFYDERTDYLSNKFNNLSLANDMSKNYSACPVHSKTNRKPMNKYTLEESYWAMWKPKNKTESNTSYQQPSMAKVESISKANGSMLNTVNIGNVPMLSNVNMGNVSMISNVNMANMPMLSNVNMGKYVQCKNCFKYIERDNNKNYSTKCLCCAHKEFYETDTDSAAYRRNGTIQEDDEEETETQGYSGETTGFMTSEDYLTTTETQDYSARNQSDQSKSKRKSSAASSRHASRQQSKTETLLEPKAIETQSGIISPIIVNQNEVEEGAYTWEQPQLDKDQNDYQRGDSRNVVTPNYDNYQNQSQYEGNYSYNSDNYHNNQSSESGEYASTTNANYNYNVYNDNPNPSDTNASNTMNTNITNTATVVPTYNSSSYYDTLNTNNNNNRNMSSNAPNNYNTSTPVLTNNLQGNANNNNIQNPQIHNNVPPNTPNYGYNPNVFKFSAPSAVDAEVLNENEIKTVNYEQIVDPAKEMITLKHTNSYIMKQKAEQAKFAQSNTVNAAASKLSSGNRIAIRPHSYPLKPILKKDKKLVPAVRTTTATKNFGMKYKK